jgi:ketosteroid isomerase-like protein
MHAFNARDLDGMLACLDPEVVFHPLRLTGTDRSYRGHDGVRRWLDQLEQLGHDYVIEVGELRSTQSDSVVAAGGELRLDGTLLAPFSALHDIAHGRILAARQYLSDLECVERLGLLP